MVPAVTGLAQTGKARTEQRPEEKMAAESSATVSLCILSGTINVQGWERNEITAQSYEGVRIELKRSDAGASKPATKVQVLVSDDDDEVRPRSGCQASSDIELRVPRGATVQVQTRDGSINISEVAAAYAGTQNGDINVERVSRIIEVGTIGGNISVSNSAGRMDLNSVGGNIVITNARPADPEDALEATSVSGDLELERVTHAQLSLRTVNGNMRMAGPLTSGGRYGIATMSGDVTLALPSDASFQLHAKISSAADIITDFPLTLQTEDIRGPEPGMIQTPPPPATTALPAKGPSPRTPPATPQPPQKVVTAKPAPKVKIKSEGKGLGMGTHTLRRLNAVCGSGDALISLASFSGTLHLQKD